ncbi:hypothetical protein [Streptomyces sp. NPDC003077]|uniref:hypothetical protein n=1 Tax=Streptomyces sp. NPDC003077 TaxID=3154443 RepID=UPI0033B45C38
MVRNVLGSLFALIGAAAAVWSCFRPWYDDRHGEDIRVRDLFGGITATNSGLYESLLLPMAFAALVAVVGVALHARALVALAGVVALGFTVLWMVRQGQAAGSLSVGSAADRGLGIGSAMALGGGVVMLLGAALMSGRGAGRARDDGRPRGPGDVGPYGATTGRSYEGHTGEDISTYPTQARPYGSPGAGPSGRPAHGTDPATGGPPPAPPHWDKEP